MQYTVEITIALPRKRVVTLFDDPANLGKWQPTLRSFEQINGTAGQPGAKSRLIFSERGREIEMIETIEKRNLPDEFSGIYEMPGTWNRIVNRFYDEGGTTRWVCETEFRFTSFAMKTMAFLMPGSFRKQTKELMENFKIFAEKADQG